MSNGFKLLTAGNPKTAKGAKLGYWTFILHLAPASLSGFNVCPMATQGCKAACLNTAGRGGIANSKGLLTYDELSSGTGRTNAIQLARIRRTRLFFEQRNDFMALLERDIVRAIKLADKAGFTPVFRLNGTSDIRWETVPMHRKHFRYEKDGQHFEGVNYVQFSSTMAAFPDVQFYDYTKLANRKNVPPNYKLTFSLADGNDTQALTALQNGMTVAAVFRDAKTVAMYQEVGFALGEPNKGKAWCFPVVNGDDTDLRFLDPPGVIVGLYAKGAARKDTSGFVRD